MNSFKEPRRLQGSEGNILSHFIHETRRNTTKGRRKDEGLGEVRFQVSPQGFLPHLSSSWKILEQIVHKKGHRLDAVVFIPGTDLQV